MTAQGAHCISVYPSTRYRKDKQHNYHLNAGKVEHFQRMLEDINQARTLNGVLYQWQGKDEHPVSAQATSSAGLLHLTQALVQNDAPTRLWVITQNAQCINKEEETSVAALNLHQALTMGIRAYAATRTSRIAMHVSGS